MNDDSHEPINKDDLQGREVDAETLVSQDSESSSQVSGTMDVQKEEDVVEKKSIKGSTKDTKNMEKEMQLKKYGVLIWYGEQCDTESSCEEAYDEDDTELQDEDTTLSSAEKTDLPTEDDDDEATELSENEDKHVGQCKEESKQIEKGEDTQAYEKENIMANEEGKIQESNEEEDWQESNKDDRQESNEEKSTADEDENTQEAEEEENRQEVEEDDMQEDEVENIMADEDDRQESNEEKTTADEDKDMQEGEEGNIAANEDEDRQEDEEDDMQEDEVENIMADEDDRQESNEEKTTADEDESTQEAEEENITANEEENRQEVEEDDMQEDKVENILAADDDRQESNEEKTTADEDEDMQEGEEGNIAANEDEDSQEADEDDMQESNEEKTTADEDEQSQEGEEDDMQEDKEENIMLDEEEETQESNEERIAADDDDMQKAEEENMVDEEENMLEEEGKNVADEEKDMQVSEEENRQESEEENIMTAEEDTQENIVADEEDSPESKEESVMAVEEEDTQEAKKGKVMANKEDCQVGKREEITGEEESSQSEEEKEEVKGDERKTDEEEEKQKVKPSFEVKEEKDIQDIGNVYASEAEALQAGNDKNEKCEKEGEILLDHHVCKERQSKPDNEEVTTDQGATEVNNDDVQKSSNDGSVTEETNKDNAETSPVLGQKHRRRTLSFDNLEIAKTTSESKSLNNSGKRTPDNSGEAQTPDECQINRTSPIIGSRLKDISGSPRKHDVAEGKFNLVITSVRGKVEDFNECNKNSQAVEDKELASGSSDVSKDKSPTSQEKNIECVEVVSESEEDNVFEECKAVVCKKCRSIWTEKVLHTIFKGSEAVTVNSKITFGAIVLINNWAHRHIQHDRETAVKNMLERADLGKNIKGLEISDLSQWLFELMDKGKIKCCAVFDAIYKPEPIKVSLSSLKKVKGASSKAIRAPCRDQDDGEMSKKRPLQLEEERLSDSHDLSKVPEVTKGARTKKKEKKDDLADVSDVQDHNSPDRAQTIKEKKTIETLEQKSEPDAQVSRLSPRQSDEVPSDEDEGLSKSHSSISEMQSKAVLDDDQVSEREEVLFETEPSEAKEVSYVYEENNMEVSDDEEGENDENVAATSILRQEEEIEPDLLITKEAEIFSGTVENRQSLLCKKLGLDINNIAISCSSSDLKRANNGTMAKQVSVEEAVSRAHITLLKERSALQGFASEAYDLLPFEFKNFYDSVHNDESTQRFMTNRELLTLHSIFILDAELPNAELFYQVLIQILRSRNQVLLVPDSRTLLQVLEKLRRDFNRAKVGKSYSEFLAQNWDMRNIYSAETLWNNTRGYPNNPNIRNVLSIFCLWKNIGKQLPDFYPSLAIQEMCKFTDLSSTDKLGMCVRLYARFCTFLYKENHPELAELFLDQKFTISNISVSRDALINSMKCQASENQRVEASLTSTETEVIQAMQNCTEAEKMALRSENPKTLRHFHRLLKQFEQKLDRYRDANAELVKKITVAETRKEKLMNKIKDPSLKGSLHELSDELSTIYHNKRKNSSLIEADQRSSKFARMESEPYEVAESTKEVIHNILAKGVKPELVRTVIQTIMKKVTGESALNLPDVFWIRKYAQENGFQSTES
ncbi:microtubule-associated protein futsch-like isoform X2 [Penaeus chinensis]|uniref:microtubule-associated protein futsch-like isoform X2 n=1 Tax=Penaeus chinensis TaxID=139456 RepID=UPI001FB74829|nr:microtubule-associated protein futsch-like isoform X2 [Penaeus chinensis]